MKTRREMLSSMAALPFVTLASKHGPVESVDVGGGKFLMFANPEAFDFYSASRGEWPFPGFNAVLYAVRPRPGMTVQDEVCIFKLAEDK